MDDFDVITGPAPGPRLEKPAETAAEKPVAPAAAEPEPPAPAPSEAE